MSLARSLLSHGALAAGLLSLSAGVAAQPPGPPPPTGGPGRPMMDAPTKRADLKARLETEFDRLDANHDGKLSPDDRQARRAEMTSKMFDRVDTNHDGAISKDEFAAAERGGPRRMMMMEHARMRMDGRGMPGWARPGMGRAGPDGVRPGFAGKEPNGPITKSDFVARGLDRFDKADTNHDGTLSPAERDAARKAMGNRGGRDDMPPPAPQGQ